MKRLCQFETNGMDVPLEVSRRVLEPFLEIRVSKGEK
jgi:hypothetical protein